MPNHCIKFTRKEIPMSPFFRSLGIKLTALSGRCRILLSSLKRRLSLSSGNFLKQTNLPRLATVMVLLVWVLFAETKEVRACILPGILCNPGFDANVNVKIQAESLKPIVEEAGYQLEKAIQMTGGETRLTLMAARQELTTYSAYLDNVIANRIDDVDQRIYAKLIWIESYTEQVKGHAIEVIQVASAEFQKITGLVFDETRHTIEVAGAETRLTITEAGVVVTDIVEVTSQETQETIKAAEESIQHTINAAEDSILKISADLEQRFVRLIGKTLILVERSADLALAVMAPGFGLVFLFIASIGWGKALFRYRWPEDSIRRRTMWIMLSVTYTTALLPFVFVSKEARALALIPASKAEIYQPEISDNDPWVVLPPEVFDFEPDAVIIELGSSPITPRLVVRGSNLMAGGNLPVAEYGSVNLTPMASMDDQLTFDLSAVYENPYAASQIIIKYPAETGGLETSVEVRIQPGPTSTPLPTPTSTPLPEPRVTCLKDDTPIHYYAAKGTWVFAKCNKGDQLRAISRIPEGTWIEVDANGTFGYIYIDDGRLNVPMGMLSPEEPRPIPTAVPPEPTPAPSCTFESNTTNLQQGQAAELRWTADHVKRVFLLQAGEKDAVEEDGQRQVTPTQTTTYKLVLKLKDGQNITCKSITINVEQRPLYPSRVYGGSGGGKFSDAPPDSAHVVAFHVRSGAFVDAVQIIYDTIDLPKHGGDGGEFNSTIRLEPGEYIAAVAGTSDVYVNCLMIETSTGRRFGPFGKCSGSRFVLNAPVGYEIVGFVGRSGVYVDAIGVVVRER
jgi:hypothetical protein